MKGYPRGRRNAAPRLLDIRKHVVRVKNALITTTGAVGVGFGTAVLPGDDLPEGNILFFGGVAYLQFQGPSSASLIDTWEGDYAIGSTPTADAALTGTEVDFIQSTPVGPAVAELSPLTRGISAAAIAGTILDNTDGSLEFNLNLLIDDLSVSADNILFTVNGVAIMSYVVLGDD